MNILHLNDKVEIIGGVETYLYQICRLDKSYNLDNYWLGIYKQNQDFYRVKEFNGLSESGILHFKKLISYLTDYCKRNEIDIIHVHSLSNPKLIQEFFKIRPVVRSMHEPRIVCPGQGKFWRKTERICNIPFGLHCFYHAYKEGCCNRHPKRLLEAYSNVSFETTEGNKGYKAIIAMSAYMIEEAIKVGYNRDKLLLNPYFTPIVEEENESMVNDNTKSLLFVGRLSKTKGVHYFIKSGIALLDKGYNIQLDIVGDGNDIMYFQSLVSEEYKDRITFHGWKAAEEIQLLLKKSYIMIFPSIYPEAFGISGIEAMMQGKPVVGFDVGGVSTWLKHTETGFLVPVKNVKKMTEKIQFLLDNKTIYAEMCKKARKVALEEFSPQVHIEKLIEIYSKAI